MSDFPEMEYQSGDAEPFELAPGETSLSFLQKIYRSPRQPIVRRMRAAALALPFESPKLAVTAVLGDGSQLRGDARPRNRRSQAPPKLTEHRPDETSPSVQWSGPISRPTRRLSSDER